MHKLNTPWALATALSLSMMASAVKAETASLESTEQKASYTLGSDIAKNFEKQGISIDIPALVQGMKDVFNDHALRLDESEMQAAIESVKEQVLARQQAERAKQGEINAKKGSDFLAKNKNKPEVEVTTSGLQYRVIQSGQGKSPTEDDYLTAHYEGRLIDGTVFDSSYERGSPIEFQINDVIKGWGEALKMMKPGAQWEIFVPPALAYGSKGAGEVIGPNETLVFTIELIKVDDQAPKR